ncbi:hypothetical protein B0T22DRAFT_439967 [Podospora appendiculata]|uniref:Uncharacterized protein n=1 Tax=Podospora appendiculata TaxID=314037 RepID=A0AAE0X9N6_9PEZI|nr:hypothetical protein B0T22DRAFT_439967 [Podospora appendiculata]
MASTTTPPQPTGPYKLITVNTAPDRARRLIGRVVEDVKEQYTILHVANVATNMDISSSSAIEEVQAAVEENQPDVLFTASMWTPEESGRIIAIAKGVIPGLKTFSLPQGLQVDKGPDAVVEYIKENLPSLLG